MARIRTIKPEFPQSESMGNVSRDARLCYIQLWTLADDSGRLRGNSRMLASLLFPYDKDASDLIDGWMGELEREDCIYRYTVDSSTYIQIRNWLIHQKIDKPSPSKIPEFDEKYRILANPRESSSEDQGSRIKDQGSDQGSDQGQGKSKKARAPRFDAQAHLESMGVEPKIARDWLTLRSGKRAKPTETAFEATRDEAERAGMSMNDAVRFCCKRGWAAFEMEWMKKDNNNSGSNGQNWREKDDAFLAEITGRNRGERADGFIDV